MQCKNVYTYIHYRITNLCLVSYLHIITNNSVHRVLHYAYEELWKYTKEPSLSIRIQEVQSPELKVIGMKYWHLRIYFIDEKDLSIVKKTLQSFPYFVMFI